MKQTYLLLAILISITACNSNQSEKSKKTRIDSTIIKKEYAAPQFTLAEANTLSSLPLHCVEQEYPNRLGQTLGSDADLQSPEALHPIFYGCFDWHSAVHGYWSMVRLVSEFPELDEAETIIHILENNITEENVATELSYFEKPINSSYERTYGWAWLLQLQQALVEWKHPKAKQLSETLQPLTNKIVANYKSFLPKLVYPIRVGEHPNTAFGLSFAYDYAATVNDTELMHLISSRAKDFYLEDTSCPITWEPSGYDFLSPCLEEVNIMRRVLSKPEFDTWIEKFMPQLKESTFDMPVGEVGDRTDGKLVHLDGVNFSRAWVLYGLANQYPEYDHLKQVAHKHVAYSYPNLIGDSYEGGHWLGSFAIYALLQNNNK